MFMLCMMQHRYIFFSNIIVEFPISCQLRFGFILSRTPPEGQAAKIFVYHSHVKTKGGFRYLRPGTEVSFIRGFDKERDLPCCLDVRGPDGKEKIDNDEGKRISSINLLSTTTFSLLCNTVICLKRSHF